MSHTDVILFQTFDEDVCDSCFLLLRFPDGQMLHRLRLTARHIPSPPLKLLIRANMATFNLPNASPSVPVHLTNDLSQDQLLSFPAFKTWISTLQHSLSLQKHKDHTFNSAPYKLRKIDIQSVDFFRGGRIGFIKLKAEVSNDNVEKLPGSVFLRGGSVGMMVISLAQKEQMLRS